MKMLGSNNKAEQEGHLQDEIAEKVNKASANPTEDDDIPY